MQFQLTVNVVAMFIVFFGAVILKDSPLNAVQMLWVNLIMDTFAALALATEPPEDDILTRMPYQKDAPIMTPPMWRNVFGHAIYQIIVLITIVFAAQGLLVETYDQSKACGTGSLANKCDYTNPYFAAQLYYGEDFDNGFKFVPNNKASIAAFTAATVDKNITFHKPTLDMWRCQIFAWKYPNQQIAVECKTEVSNATKAATADWYPWSHDILKNIPTQKTLHYTFIF